MASENKEMLEEISSDLEMTPMIDVTFLLLIFFLCATKFKTFENKLDTYLPKDTGPSSATPPDERLPTEIKLRHAGPDNSLCEIRFGTRVISGFAELKQSIAQRHDTPDKRKDLACNIYGTDQLHWKYVVMAFDAAVGVGVEKVQFGVGKENEGIQLGPPK